VLYTYSILLNIATLALVLITLATLVVDLEILVQPFLLYLTRIYATPIDINIDVDLEPLTLPTSTELELVRN